MPFLTVDFHQQRRLALCEQLSAGDIALIPAASEQQRSADTEFLFRQDSYFWYLTGFAEPDGLLILKDGKSILFCRDKDKTAEIWQGRRLGAEAAVEALNVDEAYPLSQLDSKLPEIINGSQRLWYADGLYLEWDRKLESVIAHLRAGVKKELKAPAVRCDLRALLDEMRLFKTDAEVEVMRKAGVISANAHCRAMDKCYPGMMEYQLEAELHHEFAREGARSPAYNTIVGAGDNGCILHYTENQDVMAEGELVLIDAGCELEGYAGDITRTFPVSGYFSEPQKALYQLVLDANYAAIEQVKPGNTFYDANQAAIRVLIAGLVKLDILQGDVDQLIADGAQSPYYMHGIGHWLGLDVHDVGDYQRTDGKQKRQFEPGMVLTIEPGLYINEEAEVEVCYRGIGIRIEDNLLVTERGHEILTSDVPKEISEIEARMSAAQAKREASI